MVYLSICRLMRARPHSAIQDCYLDCYIGIKLFINIFVSLLKYTCRPKVLEYLF